MRNPVAKIGVAVALCAVVVAVAMSAESNVYWRADLHQGTSIIAYGQGDTAAAALQDCYRLQAITRAMTAAETRKGAVAAVTTQAVRWCNNERRYSTVKPDPIREAALSWMPPTQNVDGSPLTNLAGYRISYGTSATALTQTIQVASPSATSYVVSNLAPGTWYFAIRSYTSGGTESAQSNIASKSVE
jgi:hypothetical protein